MDPIELFLRITVFILASGIVGICAVIHITLRVMIEYLRELVWCFFASEAEVEIKSSMDRAKTYKEWRSLFLKVAPAHSPFQITKALKSTEELKMSQFRLALDLISKSSSSEIKRIEALTDTLIEKITQLDEASIHDMKAFMGKSALCLSGGATFAFFHLGVLRCMAENNALPSVISGSSAGSLMASFAGIFTDNELSQFIRPQSHIFFKAFSERSITCIHRLITEGSFLSNERMRDLSQSCFGDITFNEAFERTGRVLNITMTSMDDKSQTIVLNHINAPNVVIWSAILGSSSLPFILKPQRLVVKEKDGKLSYWQSYGQSWTDGSLQSDVPFQQLRILGVNYFIVSQCNPHVAPFLIIDPLSEFYTDVSGIHLLLSFLRLEMVKWHFWLSDLNLVPNFGLVNWKKLFLQQFIGDTTISLPPSTPMLWALLRFFKDPGEKGLDRFILEGQRLTWPYIAKLKCINRIEKCLLQSSLKYPSRTFI